MSKVSLDLHDLSAPELVATGTRLVEGLSDNANFPAPKPSVADLRHKVAALVAANEEYRTLRLQLNKLKTARDLAMQELKEALHEEADYVEEASGGDAAKIVSANLSVDRSWGNWSFWPFDSLPQVIELSASNGDEIGEIDLVWDPVREAEGYEVELSTDLAGEGPWTQCAVASKSSVSVKELTPRIRYWFRVRAIGDEGQGEWSDAVTKFAR